MRAVALSSPQVTNLLESRFVNTWILNRELKEMTQLAPDGALRSFARDVLERYHYPVDSLVFTPTLEFAGSQSANDLIIEEDPGRLYFDFLQGVLAKISR